MISNYAGRSILFSLVALSASCGSEGATGVSCPQPHGVMTGRNVTVAIVDADGLPDVDFVERGVDSSPVTSPHATAVAQVLHACATDARLVAYRGSGQGKDVASAITTAVDAGADIVLITFGTTYEGGPIKTAVEFAEKAGTVVVAPAGNSAARSELLGAEQAAPFREWNETIYPGAYETVIAVGAVDKSGRLADFSQHREYVDLVAQGVDLDVGASDGHPVTGSSYAAPTVAAAAALAIEAGISSPEAVRNILAACATDTSESPSQAGVGAGIVSLERLDQCD